MEYYMLPQGITHRAVRPEVPYAVIFHARKGCDHFTIRLETKHQCASWGSTLLVDQMYICDIANNLSGRYEFRALNT